MTNDDMNSEYSKRNDTRQNSRQKSRREELRQYCQGNRVPFSSTIIVVLTILCIQQQTDAFSTHRSVPGRVAGGTWSGIPRTLSPNQFDTPRSRLQESKGGESKLTDWVVENLGEVTSESSTRAGDNDWLPPGGLIIANKFRVLPSTATTENDNDDELLYPIRLLLGQNGWGTGVHPTTTLCLKWLTLDHVVQGGERILDYGCGSGILGIAGLNLGASSVVGVDVEAEALITSERNMELNEFADRFEGLHTREVVPYCLRRPGADICLANILIGQLVRPSMISAIVTNLAPGALLCLSGIRPHEVGSLKTVYGDFFDWIDDDYEEMAAVDTVGSLESYGFDVGDWARLVGRLKSTGGIDIETMSEGAVS